MALENSSTDLLVLGSGSLARSFCLAFATSATERVTVKVLGRRLEGSREIAAIARCRARVAGGMASFNFGQITWTDEAVQSTICALRPRVVLHTSSLQSPWEPIERPSAWGQAINRCGFGLTLPLQAFLAAKVARAVALVSPRPHFVNACYPDAVNPVLRALGLPVTCGIGNVAILATVMETRRSLAARECELALLAHHVHVRNHAGISGIGPPRAWLGRRALEDVDAELSMIDWIEATRLNEVTGATAVPLVLSLLTGRELATHTPGPLGLPGGYPVLVSHGQVELRLPEPISRQDAIEWNRTACRAEGVSIGQDGRVEFTGMPATTLRSVAPSLASGFHVEELESFVDEVVHLREVMRKGDEP